MRSLFDALFTLNITCNKCLICTKVITGTVNCKLSRLGGGDVMEYCPVNSPNSFLKVKCLEIAFNAISGVIM